MWFFFFFQTISAEQGKKFTKYRERKGLIDKDVVLKLRWCATPFTFNKFLKQAVIVFFELFNPLISCFCSCFKVRTDRLLSFYEGDDNLNVKLLRDILLTYSFYNFDLGYCQVVHRLILFLSSMVAKWCLFTFQHKCTI